MGVIEMTDWMLNLNESDRGLVEMASEHAESNTYAGVVRETLITYLETQGGDQAPDSE
jgi:hypothetical protein